MAGEGSRTDAVVDFEGDLDFVAERRRHEVGNTARGGVGGGKRRNVDITVQPGSVGRRGLTSTNPVQAPPAAITVARRPAA